MTYEVPSSGCPRASYPDPGPANRSAEARVRGHPGLLRLSDQYVGGGEST